MGTATVAVEGDLCFSWNMGSGIIQNRDLQIIILHRSSIYERNGELGMSIVDKEDYTVENRATDLQLLVTEEDKIGTDITQMSDFFGVYIRQLSNELSTYSVADLVNKIPIADIQILEELINGVNVFAKGKYEYILDFDSIPNDIKLKLKKGIYTLGESRQVEGNVRAVILNEEGVRVKDVTVKSVLNTPDTMEITRSLTSQLQMRQISAKLDSIIETQSYLVEMERNNNIYKPFLNARDYILRAQNSKNVEEQRGHMIEASKELTNAINASRLDYTTCSEHLVNLTRFPVFRNSEQIKSYIGYIAEDLQLTTKYVGVQMIILDYLGEHETAKELLGSYQKMMLDFANKPINKKQSIAMIIHNNSMYVKDTQDYWLQFRNDVQEITELGKIVKERELCVVSIEEVKNE